MATKSCFAATLVLAGWYLLMPPTSVDFPRGNLEAPLTQWIKAGNSTIFRSQDECEHVLDRKRRLTHQHGSKVSTRYLKNAQCVSTDDSRLK